MQSKVLRSGAYSLAPPIVPRFNKYDRLVVPLTDAQETTILSFFYKYPVYLNEEHFLHTRSPLDNLGHYMWEELHEPEHETLLIIYENTGELSTIDVEEWVLQELHEKSNKD